METKRKLLSPAAKNLLLIQALLEIGRYTNSRINKFDSCNKVLKYIREFKECLAKDRHFFISEDFYNSFVNALVIDYSKDIRRIEETELEAGLFEKEFRDIVECRSSSVEGVREFLVSWTNQYLAERARRYEEDRELRAGRYRRAFAA